MPMASPAARELSPQQSPPARYAYPALASALPTCDINYTFLTDDDGDDHSVDSQNTGHDDGDDGFHDEVGLDDAHGANADS